tara:strand:- start:2086 stop:3300 length:1215 start_codon:yes stop_codon:yes gene_type:complete
MKKLLLLILIFSCSSICIAQGPGRVQNKNKKKSEASKLEKQYLTYGRLPIPIEDLTNEEELRDFFDEKSDLDENEGIYDVYANGENQYSVAVIKQGIYFNGYVNQVYKDIIKTGFQRFSFKQMANDKVVTLTWHDKRKRFNKTLPALIKNNNIEFKWPSYYDIWLGVNHPSVEVILIKSYPSNTTKKKKRKTGEWAANGSGIIISKSGYIVTNHHVIEDADDIEVEFIVDGEVRNFNAEIVQSDKVNDLAIIKIFDMNFDGLDNLPYNFKARSSDVGTKVYAYGYPMALSLMGKEIKITDGIISSKSGFDGDITTYQITAPIQGGNSGGPLFDDKGNFLGINSSGLRKDIADNVGYTIKSSYVLNLIDVLPKSIDLPSNTKLKSLPLTEQIKEISKYVVLVKVK